MWLLHGCLRLIPNVWIFLFLFMKTRSVQGNTEIINFSSILTESHAVSVEWPQLTYDNRIIPLNITPILDINDATTDTGVWLTLDLDDHKWKSYAKFTLRASWPASHPCDIYLHLFKPQEISSILAYSPSGPPVETRVQYAHVQVVNTGVPIPSPDGEDRTYLRLRALPVILILEPLHFGFLPHSVVPVTLFLVVVVGATLPIIPRLTKYFDSIATLLGQENLQAKRE